MEIHELNPFIGTPSTGDVLAIDDGTETKKIEWDKIGVTQQMTLTEAIEGTGTESRVIQPKLFKEAVEALNPYPTYYGTSTSSAGATIKSVTCSEFVLKTGVIAAVEFTNNNTAASPSLNVNSTGAKRIKRASGSTESLANAWADGNVCIFVYDGTDWIMIAPSVNQTVTETFSITRTGGAAGATIDTTNSSFIRNGKIVSVLLVINIPTEAIASGGNIFTGTLNTSSLLPKGPPAGLVGYIGSRPIIAQIAPSGTITVRNSSASSLTMTAALYVYGTYIAN